MTQLKFAIPSKGRLKEQTEAFLKDSGFRLKQDGGDRGYTATLDGLPDVQVLLLSASEISRGLLSGDFHLGVTGEDLLQEYAGRLEDEVFILKRLGFGFARMVVAVPNSWIDVETMSDLDAAAHQFFDVHGRRMQIATKYIELTRRFFAQNGHSHHRIVESPGATEAAPSSGSAELIVDITTTGSTLAANNLKILSDGEIMRSEAALSASLKSKWSDGSLESMRVMLDRLAAREKGRKSRFVSTLGGSIDAAITSIDLDKFHARRLGDQIEVPKQRAADLSREMTMASSVPVAVAELEFVFEPENELFEAFLTRLPHD